MTSKGQFPQFNLKDKVDFVLGGIDMQLFVMRKTIVSYMCRIYFIWAMYLIVLVVRLYFLFLEAYEPQIVQRF